MRALVLTVSVLAVSAGWARGVELPSWVDSITVGAPNEEGVGTIALSGLWLDTCAPDTIFSAATGNTIDVVVEHPGVNVGCGDALTPWSLDETFGPLAPGTYALLLSLFAVDPNDPEVRELVEGPTLLGLVPHPCYLGDVNRDGDISGLDIGPFVDRVLRPPYHVAADVTQDGIVNGLDVAPFIDLLMTDGLPIPCSLNDAPCGCSVGDAAVPEPRSAVLAALGLFGLLAPLRRWPGLFFSQILAAGRFPH